MARAMANCTCEKCGNTFTKIAYRQNRTDARNYEAWAEANCTICPECWKAEKEAKQKEEQESILQKYSDVIPSLTGSEKQIAWAEKIRRNLVDNANDVITALKRRNKKGSEVAADYIAWLIQDKTDSRFWIDNRGCTSLLKLPEASEFIKSRKEHT